MKLLNQAADPSTKNNRDDMPIKVLYERNDAVHSVDIETGNSSALISNKQYAARRDSNKPHHKSKTTKLLIELDDVVLPLPLKWEHVCQDGVICAELLVSAELIQLPEIFAPIEPVTIINGIPSQICPVMAKYK